MNIRKKAIYMVLVMFCLNLTVFAQNISLNLNNVTVKKAIETLKETNGYSFVFASGDIDTRKTISIAATDKPISEVVKQILNDQTLSFEIKGKNIIVKKGTDTNLPDDKKQRISGVITDANGEPVIGANVIESGTVNGTITDLNGKYSLEVSPNSTLQITYVGYDTQEIKIGGQTTINIELKEDSQALEEVIVVGYGVQKKVNLTGAVSQVSSKVLENRPITNLSQGLQGVVPNLNINNSDGNPNSTAKMNIRGAATISDDATSPLILVDGVQMTHFNMLNPEDIESISVLKDASSAAIYGARGAFGVILITTKGGESKYKTGH
ncbi:SusC/RagA family TonB-linked outer membrane protein [Parabacteroides goldsteinii]|uniref:TonB-dependent outer membrane receptor, SusC/RagA subfamily, signature region n=1 Tax=Parabacteroides goldsteinii DSM 19448 = WAL 12034 TaxID=927665 RepID=A0A0F5JGV1_9BACT|nr:STN domain-containing protein [Parabacteroides goldsteinii]KKB56785.1 TonB-dependent outer membrane receptor, SusC/RagA subfamily, signature region [Parabacteroides goldsteinii DSM 19448 = WAL 12034]